MPFKKPVPTAVLAFLVLVQAVLVFFPAPEKAREGARVASRLSHQCGCPKELVLAHKCCCSGKGRTCCLPPSKAGRAEDRGSREDRLLKPFHVKSIDRIESSPPAEEARVAACGWRDRLKEQIFKKVAFTPARFAMARPMGSAPLVAAPRKDLSGPSLEPPVPPPEIGPVL